ncbi:MAG: type II/IV secretion system protein [Granulosicoccus sp.]|nr:type II/IV secretion system protein [Granulosicoccus sp.]
MTQPVATAGGEQLLSLHSLIPSPEAIGCLPEAAARRLQVVPLALQCIEDRQCLVIACGDPTDQVKMDRLRRQLSPSIGLSPVRAEAAEVHEALEKCYRSTGSVQDDLQQCTSRSTTESLMAKRADFVVCLFEWLLRVASRLRASDLHLSPELHNLHIRCRVDGVLRTIARPHHSLHSALLVRLKILASMDIAESRRPQDGQFSVLIDARSIDVRVSCFPTTSGQNTVLRLLDPSRRLNTLASLGTPAPVQDKLAKLLHRPDGLLVICGPTGSGKSTTLHALLRERDAGTLNIMTLEDPVEQSVDGIRQTSIDAEHGLSYAAGVRALLRQDPDVLLIGEIRDSPSCAMALRAVMSGHQVLTTLHARSALAGLSRLHEFGAMPGLLAENLTGIASQRLLRTRCQACINNQAHCEVCLDSGYQGRQMIIELLVMTPALVALVRAGASERDLRICAREGGFTDLREQAMRLVEQGLSTQAELERVLGRCAAQPN